jgi:hypothetical protein
MRWIILVALRGPQAASGNEKRRLWPPLLRSLYLEYQVGYVHYARFGIFIFLMECVDYGRLFKLEGLTSAGGGV